MTEEKRTEKVGHVGAVNLTLELMAGEIEVRAAKTDVAEVTLEPVYPGDEVALDLIARARIEAMANSFRVVVPAPPGGVVGRQTVYGNNNIVVGNVIGNVVSVGDVYGGIFIGGRGVAVGGHSVVAHSGGLVRITATVPSESHVNAKTVAAPMTAQADVDTAFAEVVFSSKSGDLTVVGARRVNAHSISGDITADGAQWMHANSTSGDIRAESLMGNLDARSVSGDIRVHAKTSCQVFASSVSGDVTVTKDSDTNVSVEASSVSGRVRTR